MTVQPAHLPDAMPTRMRRLPRDSAGRPVPFFVEYIDGKPDFRVTSAKAMRDAILQELCFVCGQRLNRAADRMHPKGVFAAGPMCLINRTSAEPPSHYECAEWSARACPFLSNPSKVRREGNLPEDAENPAGIMLKRNPGVTALIHCTRWDLWRPGDGGVTGLLWAMREISQVDWYARGEPATGAEVLESIETGIGALIELAQGQADGMKALRQVTRKALAWVPDGEYDLAPYGRLSEVVG